MTAVTSRDVGRQLQEQLLSGELVPGTKLPPERDLAARFGVSRSSIREVLRSLVEGGLLDVKPGSGTFVRAPSTTDSARPLDALYRRQNATAREVNDARLMLESQTAMLAAQNALPEELDALQLALKNFDRADLLIERARYDIAFHALLAKASHNSVIETMFVSIAGMTFELMLRSLGDPKVYREGAPYHRKILRAVRNRDPEEARVAMVGHLSVATRRFGADLDSSLDHLARRELERTFGASVSLDGILKSVLDQLSAPPNATLLAT